jgi:hypothetical protein
MFAIQPPTQPALAICKLVFNSSVAVRAVGGDPDRFGMSLNGPSWQWLVLKQDMSISAWMALLSIMM